MTKAELVQAIAASMKAGEDVRIVGFGNFVAVDRPAGLARNPRTGESVERAASKAVKFRPGEGLKASIQ